MQFLDLRHQYLSIKSEIDSAVKKVLESGAYVLGPEVDAFEKEMAAYHGAKYAIGVNSGTDALYLALESLGVGKGDEVIVPPFTMAASAEVACRAGATVVFTDIDPETFNIDPKKIEKAITKRTKAIIPVHLFGQPTDMTSIMKIAKKHGLFVIEDACQAVAARWRGRMVGSIGHAGALSFFPSKNLGGYGDGGMVVTSDLNIDAGARLRRAHGAKAKYYHEVHGINSRLDPLQAAILRVKLKHLADWTKRRREIAAKYYQELRGVGDLLLPAVLKDAFHVYHQYTIRTKKRNRLRDHLAETGIPTMQYYPHALHTLPTFKGKYKMNDMPEALRACDEVLSIPVDPGLSQNETKKIIEAIKKFYAK